MGERKNPFKNVKFVVRPSTPTLKIIVIVVILLSMVALVSLSFVRSSIQARTRDLQEQAAELEHENEVLGDKIANLDSEQSIQQIAEEELDLVRPDALIIDPTS